jgi:hypothetical protein
MCALYAVTERPQAFESAWRYPFKKLRIPTSLARECMSGKAGSVQLKSRPSG